MAAAEDEDQSRVEEVKSAQEGAEAADALPKLQPVVTHDAPQGDVPEPDEFGLPVRPARRRAPTVDELESPENAKPSPVPESTAGEVQDTASTHAPDQTGPVSTKPEQDGKARVDEEEPRTNGEHQREVVPEPCSSKTDSGSRRGSSHVPQKPPVGATSEWSHQQLVPHVDKKDGGEEEEDWQAMPAYTEHRTFDDWGKVLAKGYDEMEDQTVAYGTLGGAGKGYTRVQMDEDAQSATSMDENTAYLFKDQGTNNALADEDEETQDMTGQMQMTKELLTEAQKIAYVGIVRLAINMMAVEVDSIERTKGAKKIIEQASEGMKLWGQKMMVRLYAHMDITAQEQTMVEQLADHGVVPNDLSHTLMQNARVKNPQASSAAHSETTSAVTSARPSTSSPRPSSAAGKSEPAAKLAPPGTPASPEEPPPAYQAHSAGELTIEDPNEFNAKNIDLDLRWTVLCDLFLLVIKEGEYDARSRVLLERVGAALSVGWQEICRFEKRVTDALEMQEQADKENWNEEEHMKSREKKSRNRRLMIMGLCTVGGGLVIGLSAGMLAPVIGAGLAAGFTGIGVAGTGTFLGGTGAAAFIGTTGTLIGGSIGMKGAHRRTGAVRTFEYKPLYNNKRTNLIVTVAGWMTGKVDDVRLPFSTVNPIMGDMYSVNWEPEMLQSTGQTIQILGTEALTQTIQQILGATFLATLMAGLSLPLVLTKLAYIVDNPWTVSLARADATGLILADSLIDRNLGIRPVTLVGFSLGSRVIFSCLRELARRGALGLVQNVYIFGSPVVVKKDEWSRARSVVSGRFVNGYATNDWILAYLFRATAGGVMRVAGLATVDLPGVENINVTEEVPGHMAYRGMMPTLLHSVGWEVDSVEFTEIEDPDPDNHEKRQRELLNEIEEARKELEEKPEKKGWKSIFSRKKAAQKKEWETYDERQAQILHGDDAADSERYAAENTEVVFDVEAIQREALQLAVAGGDLEEIKAHMSIREVESTLPALRIESPTLPNGLHSHNASSASIAIPSPGFQRAKSYDGFSNMPAAATQTNGYSGHTTPVTNGHNEHDSHDSDGANDDNITMVFDGSPAESFKHPPLDFSKPERADWDMLPSRPPLRSVSTTPTPGENGDSDFNPWGAEEKEVKMSFD